MAPEVGPGSFARNVALHPKGLVEQFLLNNLTIYLFLKTFYFFFLQYYSKKKKNKEQKLTFIIKN
jgi:hypothetical protein